MKVLDEVGWCEVYGLDDNVILVFQGFFLIIIVVWFVGGDDVVDVLLKSFGIILNFELIDRFLLDDRKLSQCYM